MATAIQIEVLLDEKGVVRGVQNITDGLDNAGKHSKNTFDRMTKDQIQAQQAAQLLANTIGVQLPSGLTRVLTKIPGVSQGLAGISRAFAPAAIAVGIIGVVNNLDKLKTKAGDVYDFIAEQSARFQQALISLATGVESSFAQMDRVKDVQTLLAPLIEQTTKARIEAAAAGKEGFAAIRADQAQQFNEVATLQGQFSAKAANQFKNDEKSLADARLLINRQGAIQRIAVETQTNAALRQLHSKNADDIREIENQRNLILLTGANAILETEKQNLAKIDELERKALLTRAEANKERVLQHDTAIRQIFKLEEDFSRRMEDIVRTTTAASATGVEQITEETKNSILELRLQFQEQFGGLAFTDPTRAAAQKSLDDAINAINAAATIRRTQLQADSLEATVQMEEQAAAATVAPWARSSVEIANDYRNRIREIDRAVADHTITEEQAQRRRQAAWTETNGRILEENRHLRDELAGELESVFDDITSGNIGQRILNEIKHFFAQIVASWLLGIGQMRAATAGGFGGGSLLGSLVGGLFGLGGSASATTPPFLPAGTAIAGLGASAFFGGTSSLPNPLNLPTSAIGSMQLGNMTLSAGGGTAGTVQAQTANTVYGALLQNQLGKVFTHGLSVGGLKLSGASLGMLGAGIGLTSILGGFNAASPLGGAAGGALGGALTGFSIGGPVGAAIGGVIGGIAGLFSGLFGGQKRRDEANRFVWQTVQPGLDSIVEQYKTFQLEFQPALDEIAQLQQQTEQNLGQLGKQGREVFRGSIYRFDQARSTIQSFEDERQRRGAISFAPAQFAVGGTIPGAPGQPVPIIAHGGEEVISEPSASQNRAALKAINAGSSGAGQTIEVHFHVSAIDGKDADQFIRTNARSIVRAIRQESLRYSGGGLV